MSEYTEVALRSLFVLIALFLITKLLGKKQLSQLSFFEYITGITVGSIAGTLSMDLDVKLLEGLMSILLWFSVPFIFSFISLKSVKFRHFVEGTPTVFIENGNIIEQALKKEKFSSDELLEQLRKKNIFRVSDVEFATLDTNGELSVMLKKEKQPLLYEDIFDTSFKVIPVHSVISDGAIERKGLTSLGLSEDWLMNQLKRRKINLDNVFLAQADSSGKLTIDLYDWFLSK
ncbi:DUF421 domain-containing protein [Rossellomorea vietnamensis]|uniref:DUF421 domain-containing protein n=1 Tax=Rossellomorea vietnamensis TaxID=218284 RepID=A0A5D4NSN3_9BACI|nr:DUF421 domain-containing protein [Rossellomorea vietnamensis]TYS15802.1 DUF421 domain-containing protein [Rossellomorea vietnamensis]